MCAVAFCTLFPALAVACPNIRSLYPEADQDWSQLQQELLQLFDQCLLSSEYFALLGAAELNIGNLSQAIESLERALLLDPDNGAALIDYGEALFEDGQLFAALETSELLEARKDLPQDLREQIVERRLRWEKLTRRTLWQAELSGGYDNNLNGAPDNDRVELTLSGEPIYLALSEEFRSVSGALFNTSLSLDHTRLAPDLQHRWYGRVRGRFSEDDASDVVQLTSRYSRTKETRRSASAQGLGLNHLSFAGQNFFTGTDFVQRIRFGPSPSACERFLSGAAQHQVWHSQRQLDGVELRAGAGISCSDNYSAFSYSIEMSALKNIARKDYRLGGDREGWLARAQGALPALGGMISGQIEIASVLDNQGYSVLLDNNSRRRVDRASIFLQYLRPVSVLGRDVDILVNLFHQEQKSNLKLFEVDDLAAALGARFSF